MNDLGIQTKHPIVGNRTNEEARDLRQPCFPRVCSRASTRKTGPSHATRTANGSGMSWSALCGSAANPLATARCTRSLSLH